MPEAGLFWRLSLPIGVKLINKKKPPNLMALDDLIPKDMDMICVAKLIAPYLQVPAPAPQDIAALQEEQQAEEAMIIQTLTDSGQAALIPDVLKSLNEQKAQNKAEEAAYNAAWQEREETIAKILADAEVLMPQGRLAFQIAGGMSLHLRTFINQFASIDPLENSDLEVEVIHPAAGVPKSRANHVEIRMPKPRFDYFIGDYLLACATDLEEADGAINREFYAKAKACLLQEIYPRLETGTQFILLEAAGVRMGEQDKVHLVQPYGDEFEGRGGRLLALVTQRLYADTD